MNMDWINGLASQDQSIESLMAKQSLQKSLGPLIDVAGLAQQKQRNEQDRAEKAREFEIRAAETAEQHRLAEENRKQAEADRTTAAKQSRYNVIHDNLKPGDRMKTGPDLDLMKEFGTGGQFEADPSDPEAFIYQKHAFEQAQLKNTQEKEKAQHQQEVEDKRLDLAKNADARAQKDEDRRQREEDRKVVQAQAKQKAAEAQIKDIPATFRPEVKKRAEEIIAQNSSLMDMLPWADKESHIADAWVQAGVEVRKRLEDSGLIPITAPKSGGAPPPKGKSGFTVIEEK